MDEPATFETETFGAYLLEFSSQRYFAYYATKRSLSQACRSLRSPSLTATSCDKNARSVATSCEFMCTLTIIWTAEWLMVSVDKNREWSSLERRSDWRIWLQKMLCTTRYEITSLKVHQPQSLNELYFEQTLGSTWSLFKSSNDWCVSGEMFLSPW